MRRLTVQVSILASVFFGAGIGILATEIGTRSPVESIDSDAPIIVPIRSIADDLGFVVSLTPQYSSGQGVFSPAGGLVTSVSVNVGQILAQGDPVIGIDGRDRVAIVSPEPLARNMSVGNVGEDVRWLDEFLADLGYLEIEEIGTEFDRATRDAVSDFNIDLGWPRTNRWNFYPSRVVWVGSEPFEVDSVEIQSGESINEGSKILAGPQALIRIDVLEPETAPLPNASLWQISLGSSTYDYDRSLRLLDNPDLLSAEQPQFKTVTDEGVSAHVRLASAKQLQLVPASSVVLGRDGRQCIYVPSEGTGFAPVVIAAAGGSFGFVALSESINADEVVANPIASRIAEPCD